MDVFVFFCILCNFLLEKSLADQPQKIVFSPSELTSTDVISNSSLKSALRYGFHRTHECKIFEKAYICVQKCVDLRYDLAYSDKYCFCTCYHKQEKAKYTPQSFVNKTNWKLGAPSTTKPAWAVSKKIVQNKKDELSSDDDNEEDQENTADNGEGNSNTTSNTFNDMNGLNETSTDSSNLIENGNTTNAINPDSDVSNSTADSNSGGAEGPTGVTVAPTDASGVSQTAS